VQTPSFLSMVYEAVEIAREAPVALIRQRWHLHASVTAVREALEPLLWPVRSPAIWLKLLLGGGGWR